MVVMPFGMIYLGATFQRLMDSLVRGVLKMQKVTYRWYS